ncbi:EamA family transporter [Actinomycetota bacterium]
MPARQEAGSLALVLGAIVSVQFGAALATPLIRELGADATVLLRLGLASLVMLVAVRPSLRGHDRRAWLTMAAFGLVTGAMNVSFYNALAELTLGVAVTVEFIGPLALAAVTSRSVRDLLAVLVAGAGVVLTSGALDAHLSTLPWRGLIFALLAGAFWAAYILLSRATGRAFPGLDGMALAMAIGTLVAVPGGVGILGDLDARVLTVGLGIALLSSAIPYSLELLALRRLRPSTFGILLALEPAVAAAGGLLVLGQRLTLTQLAGILLVVAASAIVLGSAPSHEPAETG